MINADNSQKLSCSDIPAGISDFEEIVLGQKVYIDKTSHLEKIMHNGHVLLLLRPPHFGMSLGMSMVEAFTEMNYRNPEDRSRQERLFRNLSVYGNREFCDRYMGRFPVIRLSLKNVTGSDYEEALYSFLLLYKNVYEKFRFLLKCENFPEFGIHDFEYYLNSEFPDLPALRDEDYKSSVSTNIVFDLKRLGDTLSKVYDRDSVIIVEDYDAPLRVATRNGYYDKMLLLVSGMLEHTFKDNGTLEKGFVTGLMEIHYQSIYSGFNNYCASDVTDFFHGDFAGFTKDETAQLLRAAGMENRLKEITDWYGGLTVARAEVCCSGSVMNFLAEALTPENNPAGFSPDNCPGFTDVNDVIQAFIRENYAGGCNHLQNLMDGKEEQIMLTSFNSCPDISANLYFDSFATIMLHAGMLSGKKVPDSRTDMIVRIPNRESLRRFQSEAAALFSAANAEWAMEAMKLRDSFLNGDGRGAWDILSEMLWHYVAGGDIFTDAYYRDFLFGALKITETADIEVLPGTLPDGRVSVTILRKRNSGAQAVLNFRTAHADVRRRDMDDVAGATLMEIADLPGTENPGDSESEPCSEVHRYGIAFYRKRCVITPV